MDTITHGIVGALIGKAFFADDLPPNAPSWHERPRSADRVAIISATLGSIFPDIDVFAGPLAHNSMAMMTWHRNITHSLVMLPVWAVLLALLTGLLARWLRWPSPPFPTLVLIYAVGLGSHVFLDLITSFGTMIWSPLDYTRPALDWLFIIDLMLTSAALVPQLAAWAFRLPEQATRRAIILWAILTGTAVAIGPLVRAFHVPYSMNAILLAGIFNAMFLLLPLRRGVGTRMGRAKWCRVGIALVAGYLAFAGGMHQSALARVKEFADEMHIDATKIAAIPQPPSAVFWAGMIETPTGTFLLQFDQLGNEPVRFYFFSDPAPNQYLDAARRLRDVQTFLWFARFPVYRYEERGDERVVQITDLRFFGPTRQEGKFTHYNCQWSLTPKTDTGPRSRLNAGSCR
jgi:membrane-bound metal-dependent hydrolase YbcI (DUF457 family)